MSEIELAAKAIKELSEVEKRQDAESNSLKKREVSLAAEVVHASNEINASLNDVADQSLKSELERLQSDLKETVRMGTEKETTRFGAEKGTTRFGTEKETVRMGITETAKPGEKGTVRM